MSHDPRNVQVLSDAGRLLKVSVTEENGETVVTLRGTTDGVHQFAVNLIEAGRLTFSLTGEQIVAAMTTIVAARPHVPIKVGNCAQCGEIIWDDDDVVSIEVVRGGIPDTVHAECGPS